MTRVTTNSKMLKNAILSSWALSNKLSSLQRTKMHLGMLTWMTVKLKFNKETQSVISSVLNLKAPSAVVRLRQNQTKLCLSMFLRSRAISITTTNLSIPCKMVLPSLSRENKKSSLKFCKGTQFSKRPQSLISSHLTFASNSWGSTGRKNRMLEALKLVKPRSWEV